MSHDKNYDHKHLYYMDELDDYKVKSKDPDVRGWAVKDADNRVVGKVDDLLVNKQQERVVYLDVEVDQTIIESNHDPYGSSSQGEIHEFVNKEGENHIIIPIGLASLNEEQKFVYTDKLNHQTFAETKRMEKGRNIDRDYEVVVLESYNRDNEFGREDDDRSREIRNSDRDYTREELARMDKDVIPESSREENRHRENKRDFETRPDDTYQEDYKSEATIEREKDLDKAWRDGRRKDYDTLMSERIKENEAAKNKSSLDEDSFYQRREFDHEKFGRGRRR